MTGSGRNGRAKLRDLLLRVAELACSKLVIRAEAEIQETPDRGFRRNDDGEVRTAGYLRKAQ
jgi:hypothetical protein